MAFPVLGLDTSGTWCSAALLFDDRTFARRRDVGHGHSDHLLAMIDAVLTDGGIGLSDCAAIAFSAGPGSFTGLRIACAVAQGLAFGADVPVAAIGSLDAMAHAADPGDRHTILVAQDARMGEIYWSLLIEDDGRLRPVIGPSLSTPTQLRHALDDHPTPIDVGCGNAWAVHGDAMGDLVARVVYRTSADAVDVACLGRRALDDGRLTAAADAMPLYVRNEVALTSAEREARKAVDAR